MNTLEAALLGLLQGFTEFLPISSSGHLALAHYFLGVSPSDLAFDVVLHLGTLFAVLAYFWAEWKQVARAAGRMVTRFRVEHDWDRLTLYLALATIPAAVFGYFLEDLAETSLRSPWVVASALAGLGLLLLLAERVSSKRRDLSEMGWRDAITVGLGQALALVPGTSRSGITMTAALFLGFNREAAARFSFLLSGPIIAGAGASQLSQVSGAELAMGPLLAGFTAAVLSGLVAIKFLLAYLRQHSFHVFAYYRLALAGAVVMLLLGGF